MLPHTASDIAIVNASIITLDHLRTRARALLVKHGRITFIGSDRDVLGIAGDTTRVIDLEGKTVLPGFIDTHVHLADFGLTLGTIDLEAARSVDEVLGKLEERIRGTPEGEWVMRRGWNEHRFFERRLLNRWDLDDVSHGHPVYLHHYTCHACVVNSLGLEMAKIDRMTKPPEGGWIDIDQETGEPTGFLRSNARFMVPIGLNGYRPRPSYNEIVLAMKIGASEAVKNGITTLHIPSADRDDILACQELAMKGELPVRVTLMPRAELLNTILELGVRTGFGNEWVKIGPVKIFSDGSLIAHTAAMKRPFEGEPNNVGQMKDVEELSRQITKAHRAGMQVAVHATGDRAIEAVLDAYEAALKDAPRGDHRHRIEHGSIMSWSAIERAKRLGVVISTQPELVTKYGDGFESSLGPERMGNAYPFRSLIDAGVVVSGSSDCPLTYCSPLKGAQAAVTRVSENMGGVISGGERISVDEAIRLYTVNAAYVGFEEKDKGTIEVGKLGDLVVLARDPWSVPESEIGKIGVEATIVGGRIVYIGEGMAESSSTVIRQK